MRVRTRRGDTLPGVSLMVAVHDLRGDGANSRRRRRRDITHRDERRGSLAPRSPLPPRPASLALLTVRDRGMENSVTQVRDVAPLYLTRENSTGVFYITASR